MSLRCLRPLLLTAGVSLFLVALTADRLGLGSSPGMGRVQVILALAGVGIAAIGIRRVPGT